MAAYASEWAVPPSADGGEGLNRGSDPAAVHRRGFRTGV